MKPKYLSRHCLTTNSIQYSQFTELYHLRWPVEKDYKTMKQWIEIENFSGKSVLSRIPEFSCKSFFKKSYIGVDFPNSIRNRPGKFSISPGIQGILLNTITRFKGLSWPYHLGLLRTYIDWNSKNNLYRYKSNFAQASFKGKGCHSPCCSSDHKISFVR